MSDRFADANTRFRCLQHCSAVRALLSGELPSAGEFATFATAVRLATRVTPHDRAVHQAFVLLATRAPCAFAAFLSKCHEPGIALLAGAAAVARALHLHASTLVTFADSDAGVIAELRGCETPAAVISRPTRARRAKSTPAIRAARLEPERRDRPAAGS